MSFDFLLRYYLPRWQRLGVKSTSITTISDVLDSYTDYGFTLMQEAPSVATTALQYLGLPYLLSEELVTGTIDCSTLTSQSYWEGALVRIPYTAEWQRKAETGIEITSYDEILPGDIVIKYKSLSESFDGKHNHVGLVLGKDKNGVFWVIEAKEGEGCILSSLKEFDPKGGVRRFCPNPLMIFDSVQALKTRGLARRVPRLGRLEAPQYSLNSGLRPRHRGVDIYVPAGTMIYSPISGKPSLVEIPEEDMTCLQVASLDGLTKTILGPVEVLPTAINSLIQAGDEIGRLIKPSVKSRIRYSSLFHEQSHLHFEYAVTQIETTKYSGQIIDGEWKFINGLYMCKKESINLPIDSVFL